MPPVATQANISTAVTQTVGNEIRPEIARDAVYFHRWWVTLPTVPFENIASYLSIEDMSSFAQTCKAVASRLVACGLEEVRYFLSLSQDKQNSCQTIIHSNRQLLQYLRTLSIFSRSHFPAQLSPAFYACYARHARQQIIDATALTLIPGESVNLDSDLRCFLNDQPRMILADRVEGYIDILTPDRHGQWCRTNEIKCDNFCDFDQQRADHILFVPQEVPVSLGSYLGPLYYKYSGEELLLSVYKCQDGYWIEQQQLTTGDVFPQGREKYFHDLYLSPDISSLVCINRGRHGAILGQAADGQWVNKGNIATGLNHNLLFSGDSRHVALWDGSFITLMGKADDGSWSETGKINVLDSDIEMKLRAGGDIECEDEFAIQLAFSPDNRHFATWFDYSEDGFNSAVARDNYFVIIAALGQDGKWYEKQRIIKTCEPPTGYYTLEPAFGPDGRRLIITSDDGVDIWELNSEDQWLPAAQEQHCCSAGSVHFSVNPDEFVSITGGRIAVWHRAASGIWAETQIFAAESLTRVSPDGGTIVCNEPSGHTDIHQRQPSGEWVSQRIEFSIKDGCFNQESCLLAVVPSPETDRLILLGMNADGIWQEKARLQSENPIHSFCFSQCSRSIHVESDLGGNGVRIQSFFSFWRIVPDKC
ncbi:WD40 repeat domain-containing protein [Endozoicomonas sp. YOMI1]|uniref:WD40 repeat domain-containing protein n=1 Tax=Endozoicomonas sp. YOMI1 TaxID=2828739 RepID=UPI0021480D2A|nr:WD40 repeat domain-containing protein [Endozoicomonas sp. YOMI1]